MGFYMQQEESDFFMSREDFIPALEALKSTLDMLDKEGRHWDWIATLTIQRATSIQEAFETIRWEVEEDGEGNICRIQFMREKLGSEDEIFNVLAPFVRAGSYIEMSGDENTHWKWKFDGQTCIDVGGKVVFDDDSQA